MLTETWIQNENQISQLQLANYTHYYNYRTDTRGGGVSIFIHNNLKHNLIESIYQDGINYLWIQVEKLAIDIGIIYNPGKTNLEKFLETYETQLRLRKRAIVFGDFNIDLLTKNNVSIKYKQVIRESGYKLLNKINKAHCTRDSVTKKSILDHVCTNIRDESLNLTIINSSFSDHKQIYLQFDKIKPPRKLRLNYKVIDYKKLYTLTEACGISNLTNSYNELELKLNNCIEESKSTKTKILNTPQADWINNDIITAIKQRNHLWIKHKKNQENKSLEIEFKQKRKEVAKLIKNTKKSYYYRLFSNSANKPKKTWTLINNLANNKTQKDIAPAKLILNSKVITKTDEICQIFNKYFATVGPLLADEILSTHVNTTKSSSPPKQGKIKNNEFSNFTPCTPNEIIKIINDLDTNTSSGIDKINTKSIKCIQNLISEKLALCFNKLMADGDFPESLKIAKVTPVYKSGNKSDPGNYRPISVLPVISKILEKILYCRLVKYLDSFNFLSERQYGFKAKSNTTAATLDLTTKIKSNIDKKNIVLGIFIDLKKAFDTVSHKLLLQKLEHIGIKGSALKILTSYLTNRSQVVKIGDFQSDALPITCGVPQGSILGPLLFLIYINSIAKLKLHGHVTLYADDTCLFYFGANIHELIRLAQEDLNILFDWFQKNLLTVNINKTCYIIFKAKNKHVPSHEHLTINNTPLEEKQCERYLGLRMDNYLTWKNQIEHIKNKLSSLIGSLYNVSRCVPRKLRFTIYNSLVKSHLLYLIEIWGSAAKTRIQELQRIQNKIIKTLFCYPFSTPTTKIYRETKLMNIKQLYIYNTCIIIRKIIKKNIQTNLTFTEKSQTTKRSLRQPSLLVLPKVRTNCGKKNITFEGAQLYNRLPSNVRDVNSFSSFKLQLSKYILEHYSSN